MPSFLALGQDAVVRRRKVSLDYENRDQPTRRIVDPWGLVAKGDVGHLVAGTEKGQRTFRVDRIVEMPVTDLVAERPSDFELSREWDLVVDDIERRRSLISATVLIVGGRCLSCATTSAGIASPWTTATTDGCA